MSPDPATGPVDVAFCVDGSYLAWAAVAALSCAEATVGERPVNVHVLHDGSLDADPGVAGFHDVVGGAGATVTFHRVADEHLPSLPSMQRFGASVWLRFLLPDVLPTVGRVLYLDADTLVASSIAPLATTDLAGCPLGAVANVIQPEEHRHLRALGFGDGDRLLNSGVLLLDLDRLRAEGGVTELFDVVRANRDRLVWPDQDALNLLYRDRWLRMHPRWNAQNSMWLWQDLALDVFGADELAQALRDPGIVHFEGPSLCKPWHYLCSHPWRDRWWEALGRTPWAGTPPEDRTVATRLVKLLPERGRLRAYRAVWRLRAKVRG